MFTLLARAGALILCLVVGIGFLGWVHPLGDSASLLRLPLGLCCAALAVWAWPRFVRFSLVFAAAASLLTTLPAILVKQAPGDVIVYSKNLWFANRSLNELVADISASSADVVMLQEVSSRNNGILDLLRTEFPHQHVCAFSAWRGIAVLSRHAIKDQKCSDGRVVAAAQIDRYGEVFWAASVHLPWPFPHGNAAGANRGVSLLRTLEGPVVMAGDFNIFPWAASVQSMQRASEAKLATPLRPTYHLHAVPLFLDHVAAPGGGQVSYRPFFGSDHLGVLARVHLGSK